MRLERLLGVALMAVLTQKACEACSCVVPDLSEVGVANALAQADVVLRGEVINSQTIQVPDHGKPHGYNSATYAIIEVAGYWKSHDSARIAIDIGRIAVFSGDGRSDCGIPFKAGELWLIFANYDGVYVPGALNTSMCTLSTRLPDRRGVEAKLGKPRAPRRPDFEQP